MITCDLSTTYAINFVQQISEVMLFGGVMLEYLFRGLEAKGGNAAIKDVPKFVMINGAMATITSIALQQICSDSD